MTTSARHAIVAGTVFDGTRLHHDCAVVIEGDRIVELRHGVSSPGLGTMHALPDGAWLAPGFIDLQVNGGGDVLLNDTPTAETMHRIAAAHRRLGTTSLLPTLISDTPDKMRAALAATRRAVASDPSVLGIHLEGPFLSPERPGVHNPAVFRVPTAADAAGLIEAQAHIKTGVMLVTLAPERAPAGFVRKLAEAGIRVSLGHSAATYAQTKAALAEGLSGFTHLFNAMPPLAGRAPGPVAAALETPGAWFSMIVDGHHVASPMLRLALRGAARPLLVTDAMPPVGGRQPGFTLNGEAITVRDGRCARADGTLAGAAISMADAVRNCVIMLGVPLKDALRYASTEPAIFLGLGDRLGRIAPGYRADLVAFNPDNLEVHKTWVAGKEGQ